ncbi:MAG: polysaccharide biosynthesis C-terminal domain-containing protein [Flavobacteriales bacterium]|nr:polysaccharide biosynthesis C-terminal domain-containing protein [Flavobacteriales bacterium]
MHRKFLLNLTLLLVLNLIIKPTWIFWIDRGVQNTVGDAYGVYFAMFNFAMLFNIFLDMGITTYNNKNIAQNAQLITKYVSGIVVFKSLLFVVYLCVTMLLGFLLGYDDIRFQFLVFLTINQFLVSFIQYLRTNISALQFFTLDSVLSVLDKLLMIIFCALLIHTNVMGIEFSLIAFICMQTMAYLVTAIIVFIAVLSKVERISLKLNVPFLMAIAKETMPYALLTLTMVFYYRVDAVMLDFMLPNQEAETAVYAQAYRLMDAVVQFGYLISMLLLPMFARMLKDKESVNSLVKLSFNIIIIPALILAFIVNEYSALIMDALYNRHVELSAPVLTILMWCFVAISSTYVFGTVLTANGSVKLLNKIAFAGLLLNVGLNVVFIPEFMAYGSAMASLVTQVLVVLFQIYHCKNIFKFNVDFKYLASLCVFGTVAYASVFLSNLYLDNFTLQMAVSILIPATFAVGIRLIDLGDIYKIVLKKG